MSPVPTGATFLYDADCGPCARFERLASFLDASHAVDFIPIGEAVRAGMLDSVPRSLRFSRSRMIDPSGSMTSGGDAVVALLGYIPACRLSAMLISRLPGGSTAARRLYDIVSRLHGKSCSSTVNGTHFTRLSKVLPPQ